MSVTLAPYAITSVAKVKTYLGITDSNSDAQLTQMINAVTDYIETYCGGRRFKSTAYASTDDTTNAGNATAELHDVGGNSKVFLNQYPVTSIEKVQYRGGTISSPQWLTYDANGYLQYLKEGYVKFFVKFPKLYQYLRFSYTAGYLIDFTNEGSSTHTLPLDLTLVATELTAKIYKYSANIGIVRVQTEGQMIMWDVAIIGSQLTDAHKTILGSYQANRIML